MDLQGTGALPSFAAICLSIFVLYRREPFILRNEKNFPQSGPNKTNAPNHQAQSSGPGCSSPPATTAPLGSTPTGRHGTMNGAVQQTGQATLFGARPLTPEPQQRPLASVRTSTIATPIIGRTLTGLSGMLDRTRMGPSQAPADGTGRRVQRLACTARREVGGGSHGDRARQARRDPSRRRARLTSRRRGAHLSPSRRKARRDPRAQTQGAREARGAGRARSRKVRRARGRKEARSQRARRARGREEARSQRARRARGREEVRPTPTRSPRGRRRFPTSTRRAHVRDTDPSHGTGSRKDADAWILRDR